MKVRAALLGPALLALAAASASAAGPPRKGGPAQMTQMFSFSSATLTCDELHYVSSGSVVTAQGNAVLVSSGMRLEADELRIHLSSRTVEALGRVSLTDNGLTLLAEHADFDGGASTGVFTNGYFESPPYRLWARRIVRVSSELYHMEHAAVTSCELDPPHYHVRIAKLDFAPGDHAAAWWPRFALEDTPVLGIPYYHKTFGGKKDWSVTVDPGHSSYQGYYAKTIFSYRLTENGTARAYWDHFSRTGEGLGGEYTYNSPEAHGSLYGYHINDRVAGTDRWNARVAHWQQISKRLSLQLNGLAQSDANFNNVYFRDDPTRVNIEAQSNGALTYQDPYYTARLSALQVNAFDPARGSFVRKSLVAPEVSFLGSPWKVGRDTYFTSNMTLRRQYDRPLANPPALNPLIQDKDRFRQTGDGSLGLLKKITLSKTMTLEPAGGVSGAWQSWRDLGPGLGRDPNSFIQGRGFTGLAFRHRPTRNLDYDLTHTYRVRWAPNQLKRDHSDPTDQGTEANQLAFTSTYRRNAATARLSTGYDLRQNDGETLITPRRKVTPPALDLSWRPSVLNTISYREVYGLYPARHPDTTQFSWRIGRSQDLQFSSGFSYNAGLPGQLQVRTGAAFALTRGWQMEGNIRFLLAGPGGLRYDSVPKDRFEQEYVIRRDLHCWNARVTYRRRPGFNEAYVRIDLKTNSASRREMSSPMEKQYYPGRDEDR